MLASATSRETGCQAPIFRAALVKPLIQPLCIFAARRQEFDVVVRKLLLGNDALKLVFTLLPLEENGWEPAWAQIARAGTSADKWPIWRISRG